MSTRTSVFRERFHDISGFGERLLHPSVTEEVERSRQKRLLLVLLGAPLMMIVAAVQVLLLRNGMSGGIVAAPLFAGLFLLAPLVLIVTGRRRLVEVVALCAGIVGTALVIAVGGGVGTPFAALVLALVIEPFWVTQERRSILIGIAAGMAAILMASLLATATGPAPIPSAAAWLTPILFIASLLARLPVPGEKQEAEAGLPVEKADAVALVKGAALLRLKANGEVVDVARQVRPLLGVEPEILLGSGLFERILISDRVGYLLALADLRDGKGEASLRLRIRVAGEGGGVVYRTFRFDLSADDGADESGEIFIVLRDDEDMAQMEDALAEARQAVEETIQARDKVLASVSHELRTPLNAILGFSDVLAHEMFGPFANEKQREYVTLIKDASSHLLNVVNVVLDVSKIQAGTYTGDVEEFDLEAAARLAVAMIAGEANAKAVHLELDVNKEIGTIRCDRRGVQQILINLLSNAVKFTLEGVVRLSAYRRGDRLFLTVSDTGIGIASEDLSRLGKPFTQIRNEHTNKGTGLGLALVKGLVQASGGNLTIESAPGAGTKVHVSLPIIGEAQDQFDGEEWKSGAVSSGEWNEVPLRKTA